MRLRQIKSRISKAEKDFRKKTLDLVEAAEELKCLYEKSKIDIYRIMPNASKSPKVSSPQQQPLK